MQRSVASLLSIVYFCCAASAAHALSWPQQAGESTRDAFQTANNFQVVTGLASSFLSLTYSAEAAPSNTLVVDENNAYWATGSGSLRAVQLSSGTLAWPSAPSGVVNGQVQLPSGVWNAPVLVGSYLVAPSEASLYIFQRATGVLAGRLDLSAAPIGPLTLSGSGSQPLLTMVLANQQLGQLDLNASLSQGVPVWTSLVRLPGLEAYVPGGASLSVSPAAMETRSM
jgi:hypothetical protein